MFMCCVTTHVLCVGFIQWINPGNESVAHLQYLIRDHSRYRPFVVDVTGFDVQQQKAVAMLVCQEVVAPMVILANGFYHELN